MTMSIIILIVAALFVLLGSFVMFNEEKVVEKAQKSKNMFNFYHIIALMTSSNYKGYVSTEEEKNAMNDYLNTESEYDSHPIGSYLKMRDENRSMLRSMKCPSFNMSELGVGFAVMLIFAGSLVLGIMFS